MKYLEIRPNGRRLVWTPDAARVNKHLRVVDEFGNDYVEPIKVEPKTDYASMHHKTLKKMVRDLGGEWTTKAAAIDFLEAHS